MSRGPAGWLLAAAVRLLPAVRQEWGTAMRAELSSLDRRSDRWRFALGCVRVIATRPAVWRHLGYPVLMLAVLAATLWSTAGVGYAPLRWGLTALVGTLVAIAALGRVRPLGPVGAGHAARAVRAGGYLLVGLLAAETVAFLAHREHHDVAGVPLLTVMFAGLLLGFLALTAYRSPAAGRTLVIGALGGTGAAAAWTAAVLAFPPIPPDASLAVLLTALGAAAAGWRAGRNGEAPAGLLAGALAGTTGALLILHVVLALSVLGPAVLIPDLVPAALTPADDLANSRIEIQDPYLWILLLAWLAALCQGLAALVGRRAGGVPEPAL